jgi:WD40 repeat protein
MKGMGFEARVQDIPITKREYALRNLPKHLHQVKQWMRLQILLKNFNFIVYKIYHYKSQAVVDDFDLFNGFDDSVLRAISSMITRFSHILDNCETIDAVANTLYSVTKYVDEINNAFSQQENDLPKVTLEACAPLPNSHHPALIKTLGTYTIANWIHMRDDFSACAISSSGNNIVTGKANGEIKVWDGNSFVELYTIGQYKNAYIYGESDTDNYDEIYALDISTKGNYIVAAFGNTIKLWNIRTGILRMEIGVDNLYYNIATDENEDFIVGAEYYGYIKVWHIETGRERFSFEKYGKGFAIYPHNNWVIAGTSNNEVVVWNISTGEREWMLTGHTGEITACAVSPNGDYIVSGSEDATVRVWNIRSRQGFALTGHTGEITACAVSPNGDYIVSGSKDTTLRVWNIRSRQELVLTGHTGEIIACAVSPNGDYIISGSEDRTLRVWLTETGELYSVINHSSDISEVNEIVIDPHSRYAVYAAAGTFIVCDYKIRHDNYIPIYEDMNYHKAQMNLVGSYLVSALEAI